jgi:Zn finger protein HypA/HybF involved in hydrogenase expression
MSLELEQTHSNFWCYQCETSSTTLTDKSTCNKCDSDAVE